MLFVKKEIVNIFRKYQLVKNSSELCNKVLQKRYFKVNLRNFISDEKFVCPCSVSF